MSKALTNTEKSRLFRKRNVELGRTELRGVYLNESEKKIIKKLIKEKTEEIRKE